MPRRRLTAFILVLPLAGCFADNSSSNGSTGAETETADTDSTETGSDGTDSGETDGTGSTGTSMDVPAPQPWDPCESEADCPASAPLCLIDDYGRGFCTAPCDGALQCPSVPAGDAGAVCSAKKVCLLNCSPAMVGDPARDCPEGMFCTDTNYDGSYSGGVCLWDDEPDACAAPGQPCFAEEPDCCMGECVDSVCT